MLSKKVVSLVMATMLVLGLFWTMPTTYASEAYKRISLYVDGNLIDTKNANGERVELDNKDGTTRLPIRALANALGKEVDWDGEKLIVYLGQKPETDIVARGNGKVTICVDGEVKPMLDAAGNVVEPEIVNGTTMVPVRGSAVACGKEVSWDEEIMSVYVGDVPVIEKEPLGIILVTRDNYFDVMIPRGTILRYYEKADTQNYSVFVSGIWELVYYKYSEEL